MTSVNGLVCEPRRAALFDAAGPVDEPDLRDDADLDHVGVDDRRRRCRCGHGRWWRSSASSVDEPVAPSAAV